MVRVHRHGIAEVFHISSITHTYREQPILLIPGVRVIGTLGGTLTLNMATRIGGAHQARSVTLGNADPVAELVIAHRHARTVGRRDAYQATFRVGDPQVLILTGTSIGNNRGQRGSIRIGNIPPVFADLRDHTTGIIIGVRDLKIAARVNHPVNQTPLSMRIGTRSDTGRYSGEQTRYLHRGTRLSSFGIGIGNVLHRLPGTLTNGVVRECRRRAHTTGFLSGLIVHMNTAMRHRMHQIRHGTIFSQNKHCQAAQVPLSARHRCTRGRIEIRFVLVIVRHPHKRNLRNHSRTTRDFSLLVGLHLRIAHPSKQFIRGGNLRQPPRLPGGAGEPFAFPIKEHRAPVRHKPRGLLVPKAQTGVQGREPAKPEHARWHLIRMGDRQTVVHTRQR